MTLRTVIEKLLEDRSNVKYSFKNSAFANWKSGAKSVPLQFKEQDNQVFWKQEFEGKYVYVVFDANEEIDSQTDFTQYLDSYVCTTTKQKAGSQYATDRIYISINDKAKPIESISLEYFLSLP